ncbi:MAG TPA: nucleotidyltransferase domain-containing protein [Aquifex aeolicus]|uniref:Nucleotidyltransferase domain-containing protein n=1 Tax=Aquifex aeolicus TaxID=63363 RepID=A0A7C5L9D5_AQUAO|nr:nucleotidyltransferase domain-containing protein [Aquifex aeolicus]
MSSRKVVRLSDWEVKAIKDIAEEVFGEGTRVFLFGSRTDPTKRGGDIDLYIIPANRENLFDDPERLIEREAMETGVEL